MNLHRPEWDVERPGPGAAERFMHVGRRLGGEGIGATLFDVEPGWRGPFHLHYGNEEWVLVVEGAPTLRWTGGERELRPGDVAVFPRGDAGAHALENRSGRPARFVVFSTMVDPDVAERTEAGLVSVFAGGVPTMGADAEVELFFPRDAAL